VVDRTRVRDHCENRFKLFIAVSDFLVIIKLCLNPFLTGIEEDTSA